MKQLDSMVSGKLFNDPEGFDVAPHLVRSALWNYLGYFCELCAGALLIAYVVRRVSLEDYGIYVLAQSTASILCLLDFGLSGVLIPLYSWTLSSKGKAEVGRLVSTLILLLFGLGTLGATVLSLLALGLPELINLPSVHTALVLKLLVLAAVTVQFTLPSVALDCLYQASHRFDRLTQVQISMLLLRVGLTVAVVAMGSGIVAIAVVRASVSFAQLVILWAVLRLEITGPSLKLFCFDRSQVPKVLKVTGWAFGGDLAQRIGVISEKLILAGVCSFGQVAMFGLASRLPEHFVQFAGQGLSVLTPSLSRSHSDGNRTQIQVIYQNACSACLTGLMPLVVFAAICAKPLMEIWGGRSYSNAGLVMVWLLILALSRILEHPSELVLYSHNRVRAAARIRAIEMIGKIGLALALAVPFGAAGVAAGVAVCHWCVNLFLYLPEACRAAETPPWELLRKAATGNMRLIGAFVLGAGALAWCSHALPVTMSFWAFVGVSFIYAALWWASTSLPIRGADKRDVAPVPS